MPKKKTTEEKLEELRQRAAEKVAQGTVEPTVEEQPPKPRRGFGDQSKSGATRSANQTEARNDLAVVVDKVLAVEPSRRVPLSDDQLEWALDRIAAGDTMRNVTKSLGISRAALAVRAHDDPDGFGKSLSIAQEIGTWSRLENAEDMIMNGELSTGSFDRDREALKYAMWMASKLNRTKFGDKLQIDHRSVNVHIAREDSEWN